jgi:tight adherence protein C
MILALIALTVFGSVVLLMGALAHRTPSAMEARIQDFRSRAAVAVDEDDSDLSKPFADRVIRPGVEGLARFASSVLPQSMLANIQKQLISAGNPMTLSTYVAFWVISLAVFSSIALVVLGIVGTSLGIKQLALVALLAGIGWMLPRSWLSGKVKARQKLVVKAMPDAMDLITTCVQAGLGLDGAMARVSEKSTGPLADEISRTLRDIAMGKLRRDALLELSERVGVDELSGFINSIVQAEQLGVGVSQALRVQSETMRMRRRQRAEKSAHEAPIKMIFPLVLFIFPAFMLVILGPAGIQIAQTLL